MNTENSCQVPFLAPVVTDGAPVLAQTCQMASSAMKTAPVVILTRSLALELHQVVPELAV